MDQRKDFLRNQGLDPSRYHKPNGNYRIPEELRDEWQKEIARIAAAITIRPLARDNKSRILLWMIYWPWSAVWTLINDPVKRVFKWIYRRVQRLYEWMSERVFSGVETDLPPAPKEITAGVDD